MVKASLATVLAIVFTFGLAACGAAPEGAQEGVEQTAETANALAASTPITSTPAETLNLPSCDQENGVCVSAVTCKRIIGNPIAATGCAKPNVCCIF